MFMNDMGSVFVVRATRFRQAPLTLSSSGGRESAPPKGFFNHNFRTIWISMLKLHDLS